MLEVKLGHGPLLLLIDWRVWLIWRSACFCVLQTFDDLLHCAAIRHFLWGLLLMLLGLKDSKSVFFNFFIEDWLPCRKLFVDALNFVSIRFLQWILLLEWIIWCSLYFLHHLFLVVKAELILGVLLVVVRFFLHLSLTT